MMRTFSAWWLEWKPEGSQDQIRVQLDSARPVTAEQEIASARTVSIGRQRARYLRRWLITQGDVGVRPPGYRSPATTVDTRATPLTGGHLPGWRLSIRAAGSRLRTQQVAGLVTCATSVR